MTYEPWPPTVERKKSSYPFVVLQACQPWESYFQHYLERNLSILIMGKWLNN